MNLKLKYIIFNIISLASPTYSRGDIVSTVSKLAKKIGVPLKNVHMPGHK